MKVYVIKRDDGKYLKITIGEHWDGEDYFEYEEDEFVDDLYEATLYSEIDFELLTNRCKYQLKNCKVVPVEIKECRNGNEE